VSALNDLFTLVMMGIYWNNSVLHYCPSRLFFSALLIVAIYCAHINERLGLAIVHCAVAQAPPSTNTGAPIKK